MTTIATTGIIPSIRKAWGSALDRGIEYLSGVRARNEQETAYRAAQVAFKAAQAELVPYANIEVYGSGLGGYGINFHFMLPGSRRGRFLNTTEAVDSFVTNTQQYIDNFNGRASGRIFVAGIEGFVALHDEKLKEKLAAMIDRQGSEDFLNQFYPRPNPAPARAIKLEN